MTGPKNGPGAKKHALKHTEGRKSVFAAWFLGQRRAPQSGPVGRPGLGRSGGLPRSREPDHQDLVVCRVLGSQRVHAEKIGNVIRICPGDGIDII